MKADFVCRLKPEHIHSGKKRQINAPFTGDALETRDI